MLWDFRNLVAASELPLVPLRASSESVVMKFNGGKIKPLVFITKEEQENCERV